MTDCPSCGAELLIPDQSPRDVRIRRGLPGSTDGVVSVECASCKASVEVWDSDKSVLDWTPAAR